METENNTTKKSRSEEQKSSRNALARYSGMAFQIGGAIILGVIAGTWMDGQLDSKSHCFTTLFTIIGVFVGLYSVVKMVSKK